jgi:hypothetical protein
MSDHAGNINNPSGRAPHQELPQDSFRQIPDAARQSPLFVELLDFHGKDIGIDGLTGVVDQHIDTTGSFFQLHHHRFHIFDNSEIGFDQKAVFDFGKQLLRPVGAFTLMNAEIKSFRRLCPAARGTDTRSASFN